MRYGSIYVLTNTITGDQYVGQTVSEVRVRWRNHVAHAKNPKFRVQRAIAEFGPKAFHVQEVFVAFDREALNVAEVELIAALQPVYNMTRGGAGAPVCTTSDSLKTKRAEAARLRWADPDFKQKVRMSLKNAGTPEYRQARSERLIASNGGRARWKDHIKAPKNARSRREAAELSWLDPTIRARRLLGHTLATQAQQFKDKQRANGLARGMPQWVIDRATEAKHKPIYCPELQVTFLSRKDAAEHLGVVRGAISNAVKNGARVARRYTMIDIGREV